MKNEKHVDVSDTELGEQGEIEWVISLSKSHLANLAHMQGLDYRVMGEKDKQEYTVGLYEH